MREAPQDTHRVKDRFRSIFNVIALSCSSCECGSRTDSFGFRTGRYDGDLAFLETTFYNQVGDSITLATSIIRIVGRAERAARTGQ